MLTFLCSGCCKNYLRRQGRRKVIATVSQLREAVVDFLYPNILIFCMRPGLRVLWILLVLFCCWGWGGVSMEEKTYWAKVTVETILPGMGVGNIWTAGARKWTRKQAQMGKFHSKAGGVFTGWKGVQSEGSGAGATESRFCSAICTPIMGTKFEQSFHVFSYVNLLCDTA